MTYSLSPASICSPEKRTSKNSWILQLPLRSSQNMEWRTECLSNNHNTSNVNPNQDLDPKSRLINTCTQWGRQDIDLRMNTVFSKWIRIQLGITILHLQITKLSRSFKLHALFINTLVSRFSDYWLFHW